MAMLSRTRKCWWPIRTCSASVSSTTRCSLPVSATSIIVVIVITIVIVIIASLSSPLHHCHPIIVIIANTVIIPYHHHHHTHPHKYNPSSTFKAKTFSIFSIFLHRCPFQPIPQSSSSSSSSSWIIIVIMAVLASDGLWDTHTNEEAVALVSKVVLIMVEVVTRPILWQCYTWYWCRCAVSLATGWEELGGLLRSPTPGGHLTMSLSSW